MADDLTGLDQAISQVNGAGAPPVNGSADGLDAAIAHVRGQRRDETATAVRNGLQFAGLAKPDEEAGYRHLARFTGMPLETVRNRPDAARVQASLKTLDADQMARITPATADALTDPSTMRMLHDDIPGTAAVEQAVKALPKRGAIEDMWSAVQSTFNKVSAFNERFSLASAINRPVNPAVDEHATALTRLAIEQTPQTIPGAVVGGLAYAPYGAAAPLVVAGAEGHARTQELQDEGVDDATATLGGAAQGGIMGLVQLLPMGRLIFGRGAGPLAKSIGSATVKAGAVGAGQELGVDLTTEQLLLGVGQNDLAAKYAPTAEKLVHAAAFQAGIHLGTQGLHALLDPAQREQRAAQEAQQAQQQLQALSAAATASKFRERDQEAFHDFVDGMGAPDLYIGGRQLAEALDQSGIGGDELRHSLPDVASQMREALQTDGLVRIPMADYAAHLAGGKADAAILPRLRTSPEGMTFDEAQKFSADQAAQAANEAQAEPDEQAAAFRAAGDEVHKGMLERLAAVNRFPADVNRQYADLVRAYYDATAQRTGVLPTDLFHAFPLDVRAEGLGELQQNGELMQTTAAARASYSPERAAITLNKEADLSSFLHEAGHHFLETHARLALDEKVPDALRADVRLIVGDPAEWLAKSLDDRRDVHEQFARSFEAYLMEGKAPTPELRTLFQRFRSWLVQVYRSVVGLRANLSPDLRAVMDRMLASDDAIHAQEAVRSMEALFPAKPEGMTDEAFRAYRALGQQASERASAKLQDASLRDMKWLSGAKERVLRELQAQARDARNQVREQVTKEVDAVPAFQAKAFLDHATDPNAAHKEAMTAWREQRDAQPKDQRDAWAEANPAPARPRNALDDWKAERDTVETAAREAEKARVTAGKTGIEKGQALAKAKRAIDNATEAKVLEWEAQHPKPTTERRPVDLDIVAERFGFSSGDEMAQAIADAGSRTDIIKAMTDQRMLEQHGELTDPIAIERAADEAIHNRVRARFIATELNALAKATGSPALLAKAARSAAEASIAQKRVRDLRPDQYTAAEGRAGREAMQAFKKGDVQTAAVKKRAQLLSNALARAALDARAEVAKGAAYLKKFDKSSIRGNLSPEFLTQIDALLERYDLRQATGAKIDKAASLRSFVQSRLNAGEMPIPVQAEKLLSPAERAAFERQVASRDENGDLVYADTEEQVKLLAEALDRSERTPYQELTVEAFRGLHDTVKMLEHLARQQNKLMTAEVQRSYEEICDEIAGSIEANASASGKGDRTSSTWLGSKLQAVREFGAAHIKVATWARIMDGGKDDGPVWRYLVRPANDAATKETSMRAEATRALATILRPVIDKVSLLDKSGKGRYFKELGTSLNWQERMGLALNYGNEGNLQRLLGGGIAGVKQRLTQQDIVPVLRSLTADEWRAVQAVWDHLDTYRPEIGALERRMSGVEPEWVEPRPFRITTADGQTISLRGGYYPILYDPRGSLSAQQHADALDSKAAMRAAYSAAATQHGFTKNRVEEVNGRPLMLNMQGVYRGVSEVVHDLAWREWVRDGNKLLRSKTIDAQIRDHYGPEVKREIEKWRDDIVVGNRRLDHGIEKGAAWMRRNVSAAGLVANVLSAAQQPLGLTQSIVRVGPKWVGRGLAEYVASPVEATRAANAKSDFMANRTRTRFRELNELRNAVQGETAGREMLGRYGYWLMMRAQQMVDVPTWHGGYEKALADGASEADAVRLADQAVKDSQGGGEEVDQSGIERGGPLVKLFTTFYSFMNTAANLGYLEAKTQRSAAKLAVNALLLYSVPAVLGQALKDALTPGDSGNWDEEHIVGTLAKSQISFLLGLVAFGREFGGLVNGQDYSGPAGLRTIVDAYKLEKQAAQGEFDDAFRKAFVNAMGDLMGLPSAQINRSITGAEALSEGETDNPAALLTGYQTQH